MKIIKYFLFLLLIAFIAGSIYIATKDGEFQMERTLVFDAPAGLVYSEVQDLANWNNWSPWNDEDIVVRTAEESTGKGAELTWKSDRLGNGSLETISAIPDASIEQKMITETSIGQAESLMYWNFEEVEEGTKVTWGIKGDLDFKEKLAFFLADKQLPEIFAAEFEQGLEELEEEIKREMEVYSINVDGTTRHGGGYYMYSTTATKINEVYARASEMIEQVSVYMESNNIPVNGNPFIIYNRRNENNGTTIFSAAVPTTSLVITPSGSDVLNGLLPPQRVVKTTLKGNYSNTGEAWETAYRYIERNGLRVDPQGEPFEILITTPAEDPNPAKWVTEIYIPVQDREQEE
ncbi:MAG TPA: GyrI-like domain-containing protein [Salinimicrobium sp.]|nr:GyrI-like domain-containing protein [Salinimicrobium sp.]